MVRALVGFLKGLVVGGGVGYGLYSARIGGGSAAITYAACAVVGALVGLVCGRAPWRSDTIWTPVVKALFGGAIGAGLCAIGMKFVPAVTLLAQPLQVTTHDATFLAAAVGILYGTFVEIDDGGADDKEPAASARSAPRK